MKPRPETNYRFSGAGSWSKIWKAGLIVATPVAGAVRIFFAGITTGSSAAGVSNAGIINAVGVSLTLVTGLTSTASVLNTPEVDAVMVVVATAAWPTTSVGRPLEALLVQANLEVATLRIVCARCPAVTAL